MIINGYKLKMTEAELNRAMGSDMLTIKLIGKDFPAYQKLSVNEKAAVGHLIAAADIMNDVFLQQDHPLNLEMRKHLKAAEKNSSHARSALAMFNAMNGVSRMNAIDKEPTSLFVSLDLLSATNCYPSDITKDEFHQILISMLKEGKAKEVQDILSQRTMVRRQGNELVAIDYTEYFKHEFASVANLLNKAANLLENEPEDKEFKEYLRLQAAALTANNPMLDAKADKAWANMQDTKFEFTLSRESYGDMLSGTVLENEELKELIEANNIAVNPKDFLGIRVGLINEEGTNFLLKFREMIPEMAPLMPYSDTYKQKDFSFAEGPSQTMVDVDVLALSGDYATPSGGRVTLAQNLPNNDKPSFLIGGGRRNVYHRQVLHTNPARYEVALKELLMPEDFARISKQAEFLFVIGHENGHSLGPLSEYQDSIGIYRNTIEELKADVVSVVMMKEYYKAGVISKRDLEDFYTFALTLGFLNTEPTLAQPHRVADLIAYNFYKKSGAISFDEKAGKVLFNIEALPEAAEELLKEVISVQLSKDVNTAKKFVDTYSSWGKEEQYISDVLVKAGSPRYRAILPQIKDRANLNQAVKRYTMLQKTNE